MKPISRYAVELPRRPGKWFLITGWLRRNPTQQDTQEAARAAVFFVFESAQAEARRYKGRVVRHPHGEAQTAFDSLLTNLPQSNP